MKVMHFVANLRLVLYAFYAPPEFVPISQTLVYS